MKQLLKGGRIINPENKFDDVADLLIEDGKIKAIGKGLAAGDADIIDVSGKIVTPGLIDMHVHFREPGQEAKEDFVSGSKAAAAGGYTTVATMPNTKPVVDTAALVRSLQERAREAGLIHVEIIGALTKGQKGEELAEVGDMTEAGAVAFSDDGHFVKSAKVLLNGFDYLRTFDKIIINHDEEPTLVEEGVMNESHHSAMLGMKGRPTVAEDIAVARDILLAEYADARVHVAHISSARSVDLVREAKKRGVKVTAEATPQHLTMTDDCVNPIDSSTKINPPLREQKDVDAVLAGLKDGTIDAIVTDHSPHAQEEKDRESKCKKDPYRGDPDAPGYDSDDCRVDRGAHHVSPAGMYHSAPAKSNDRCRGSGFLQLCDPFQRGEYGSRFGRSPVISMGGPFWRGCWAPSSMENRNSPIVQAYSFFASSRTGLSGTP